MTKLQERLRTPIKLINDPPWHVRYLNGTQEGLLIREREEAADALDAAEAAIARLKEERDRIERNRDMWKGQCERQAEQLSAAQPPAVGEDVVERAAIAFFDAIQKQMPEPEKIKSWDDDAGDPNAEWARNAIRAGAKAALEATLLRTKDAG